MGIQNAPEGMTKVTLKKTSVNICSASKFQIYLYSCMLCLCLDIQATDSMLHALPIRPDPSNSKFDPD